MARNTADACMFCGHVHTGNCPSDKPKPVRVPRKLAPKPAPVSTPSAGPVSTKTDSVPTEDPFARLESKGRPNLSTIARVRDPEAELLSNAVTCLAAADLLHYSELRKHRAIIKLPDVQVDIMIWKQVNDETVRTRAARTDS